MDRLLYNAAVYGYKNLPLSIADEDNNDDEDEGDQNENDKYVEWRNLRKDEEYYTRKTESGNNILHLSVQLEHFTFAEKAATRFPGLISEANDEINNSLHIAAQIGDVEFVKKLVSLYLEKIKDEESKPWMAKNKEGNTPLHVALMYGRINLACYLVELESALSGICNHSNEAPLHLAIRHRINYDREMVGGVLKLLRKKLDLRSKVTRCCKLEKDSMRIVKLLLKEDPSIVNWRDNKGLTPPLLAATLNPCYVEAMYEMLQCCPESSEKCDDFGNTMLHLITKLSIKNEMDGKNVVQLLRFPSIRAQKNKQNNAGNTPTHMAIHNNNIDLIVVLIESSVNLAIKNKEGISAADLIQRMPDKFRTLTEDKMKEILRRVKDLREYESYVSPESIIEVGFSIERIEESKILHKMTIDGNILHTLLREAYPEDMEDNKVRDFIIQVLDMAPSLICETNFLGRTPLHLIAKNHPSLIDERLREMIESCYKRVIEEEDAVEGLGYDPPWTVKDYDGNTILHLAFHYRNWPASWMEQILRFDRGFGMEVNNQGQLPIHLLLTTVCSGYNRRQNADMVKSGLAYSIEDTLRCLSKFSTINSNVSDEKGLTPLLIAAQSKDLKCFNLLLEHHLNSFFHINCDLKTTYDNDPSSNTFWHHIASTRFPDDYYDSIESTWSKSCSPARNALTQRNKNGKTPFHLVIENDNLRLAEQFSKILRYDKYAQKRWEFSLAVYQNMGDEDGNVPLHMVVGKSNLPYAREFIKCETSQTNLIGVHNKMGITSLHLAVSEQDMQFLNIIFDVKKDDKAIIHQILEMTDKDNNTPLHYAISRHALPFVDKFFDEGVRVEYMDKILSMSNKDGNAPLHLAVLEGYSSLATKFIDIAKEKSFIQEMQDKKNTDGDTALHLSVSKFNLEIANTLLKTAKENNYIHEILGKRNNEGNTPLHLAIQNRKFDFVRCFIEYANEDSCIGKILVIPNEKAETPGSLIGSEVHLPNEFENFFWNEPKVVEAMLGIRSLSGVSTKMIKEYTNTIGVIAALLATITFTAGFAVPGGLNSGNGTPVLMQKPSFQVFMVSDIIAMCLSMMVLFFLMWIMTINDEKHQVILLDLTVFSLQGAFYATILTFMTGLYASVFPSTHWIAIFACVLCSLLILLMHKRLIIWFIPGFIHIYVWYQKVKKLYGHKPCCCFNKKQNDEEPSGTSRHAYDPTGHSQTVLNIESNN